MRSKDIGTRAETAVVNLARQIGYKEAERLPLHGAEDQGDIRLSRNPLIILEVKAGKAAQNASWNQIQAWMKETMKERNNAWKHAADREAEFHGFLVTQRKGYGVGRVEEWCIWTCPDDPPAGHELGIIAMYPLKQFLTQMKWEGILK